MPSDEREATALASEIQQLQSTAATLRAHKEHFDSLIGEHEKDSSGGGFFASLAGALHGFVEVVEQGLFGGDDGAASSAASQPSANPDASGDRGRRKGIRGALANLQAGMAADTTEADRADTVAHLRQVTVEIQERLDRLSLQIAERQERLDQVRPPSADALVETDDHRDDPAPAPPIRKHDPDPTPTPTPDIVDPPVVRRHDPVEPTPVPVSPTVDVNRRIITDIDISPVVPSVVVTPSQNDEDVLPTVVVAHVIAPPFVTPSVDVGDRSYDPNTQADIGELAGEIYDVNELLQSGKTVADLRSRDIPAGVLTASGVAVHALLGGGYTVADLHEAGVTVFALRSEGVSVTTLHEAGYGLDDLRTVASVSELNGIASASELRAAGFTAAELHGTYPVAELASLFSVHELRDAGFRVDDLRGSVSLSDLRSAFDLGDLSASFSAHDLRAEGVSASDLLHGNFSLASLQEAGFSYHDLLSAGASAQDLRNLYPHESLDDAGGDRWLAEGAV